jgi:hypothetical protein
MRRGRSINDCLRLLTAALDRADDSYESRRVAQVLRRLATVHLFCDGYDAAKVLDFDVCSPMSHSDVEANVRAALRKAMS